MLLGADGLAVAGFVVGVVALVLAAVVLVGEWVRRPRLVVRHAEWGGNAQLAPVAFLVVRVFNEPAADWVGWLFPRRSADGCRVSLTYFKGTESDLCVGPIDGRWSAAPEPLSYLPHPAPDPSKIPASFAHTVTTTGPGEEVAIATTREGEAWAFSAESYMYPDWRRPGWRLDPGRWRVVVYVATSEASVRETLPFRVDEDGALAWG